VDGRGAAALIAAVVTGRLALTWACRRGVAAARPDGLGALVAGSVRPAIPAATTLAVLAAAVAAVVVSAVTVIGEPLGWTLPLAVVAGLAAAFVLERHAVRRLGGITGDVLGALIRGGDHRHPGGGRDGSEGVKILNRRYTRRPR
jgi:adenosylcobinamide-GDP ribazoletransferase